MEKLAMTVSRFSTDLHRSNKNTSMQTKDG